MKGAIFTHGHDYVWFCPENMTAQRFEVHLNIRPYEIIMIMVCYNAPQLFDMPLGKKTGYFTKLSYVSKLRVIRLFRISSDFIE